MLESMDDLLEDWPYDDDDNVRKITDKAGKEKVQIRVDHGAFQGMLQMELDGRPDGSRPHGRAFALDHFEIRASQYTARYGSSKAFALDHQACKELFDESYRVYERYVFLLQLKDFKRVVRDTQRNMKLFRFVHRHAAEEDDRNYLQRWWPYIIRINAEARSMRHLKREQHPEALEVLYQAKKRILGLEDMEAEEFLSERQRSAEVLDDMIKELGRGRPMNRQEKLQKALDIAVDDEEYERAATIRDQLGSARAASNESA